MLRIERICVYIIMLGLILLIPSIQYISYLDEFGALLFGCIAALDCVVNRNWRKYKLLWIVMAIMAFYAVYSVTMVHFNVLKAVMLDWVITIKPFLPFIVMFAVAPRFTESDKRIIRGICVFNAAFLSAAFCCGHSVVEAIVFHVTYGGTAIFASMMFYLYCSIDSDGKISRRDIVTALVLLTFGLLCTRAKYYAIYVLVLYFLYVYRPGMLRQITPLRAIGLLFIGVLVLAVSWHKIEYYFLVGNSDSFDPTVVQSFARPVLYVTGFLILFDFFPFGTGLGTFASYASQQYYSGVYYYYGIDKVHGLSERMSDFICDAYYPSLAQFGVVGLILFICFWCYSYKFLRNLIRVSGNEFRYPFIVGSLLICFILIECTSGNTFTQIIGTFVMALYGMICAQGKALSVKSEEIEKSEQENIITRKI